MRASTTEQFVENLEIEILGSGRLWRAGKNAGFEELNPSQSASAFVDAASVVTFVDGISTQQKEDVLNSTLLAQLSANQKQNRERDFAGWYATYRTVLEQLGWSSLRLDKGGGRLLRPYPLNGQVISRDPLPDRVFALPFNLVQPSEARFRPEAMVLKLLKPVSKEDEFSVTEAALDALKELPDRDRRVVIFESNSHSSTRGSFQIAPVRVSLDGTILMTIAAFFFNTNDQVTRVLSFNFGRLNTQMFQARHNMYLEKDVYSRVRDQVIERLGDQASALIDELEI